jgi:hypothetical protein
MSVARLEGRGADMTRRWKRRFILASLAVIAFTAVPLPNVLLPNVPLPSFVVRHLVKPNHAALEQYCRVQARSMQSIVLAGADVASLEAQVWDRLRPRCGEWQSYVGG